MNKTMEFITDLLVSGYYFQPECGVYAKDNLDGTLSSYLQDPNSIGDLSLWSFQKTDESGNIINSDTFTL